MTDHPEDPNADDIQALWQAQEQESPAMTLQAVRMLVRSDRDHMRSHLMFGFVLIAIEAVLFMPMVLKAQNEVIRVGGATILVGLAWMVWRILGRLAGRQPGAQATTQTLIAFQRQALLRRRTGYGWLLVSAGPMMVGLLIATYGLRLARPHSSIANVFPLLALMGLWFVGAWFMQRRQSRRLQEQIEDLDRLAKGG